MTSQFGIDFALTGDGTGGGMENELFNDYEEGTWTPFMTDENNNASESQTYTTQLGVYTKIGNRVFVSGTLTMNSLGSLDTTCVPRIQGLPFNTIGCASNETSIYLGYATSLSITAGNYVSGYTVLGGSYFSMQKWSVTGGTSNLTIAEWSDGGGIQFALNYKTAS